MGFHPLIGRFKIMPVEEENMAQQRQFVNAKNDHRRYNRVKGNV
jgi:hypothetical protein